MGEAARKSILLKTADNVGMEIENIFDYFSDIKIISNHDGYFYSVNEALKILLLGLLCGRKNIKEIYEWATEDIIKEKLSKEFCIDKIPCYYWLTCLLKLINIDSLNECFMNMASGSYQRIRYRKTSYNSNRRKNYLFNR